MVQLAPPQLAVSPIPEKVIAELDRICASPAFQGSKRSQQFLEHVCRNTLDGHLGSLKERALAVDVFGRSAASNMSGDTIVRVGAREVRNAVVVIELPAGSCVREFRYLSGPVPPSAPAPSAPAPWPPGGGALPPKRPSNSFGPRLQRDRSAPGRHQLTDERLDPQTTPEQRPIDVAPNQLDATDLISVRNKYIGFGDMIVTTEIASILARRGQTIRIRWADRLPFADLRQARTLLVGAVINRWTIEISQRWRFQFRRGADRKHSIVDTPGSAEWRATAKDDDGGSGVAVLEKAPSNRESRSIQVVLQVKAIGNTPGQPVAVAHHVW